MVRPFLTKSTSSKIVVIHGSCAVGTANNKMMEQVVGVNWREVTGATMSQETPQSTPGYRHLEQWRNIEKEEDHWRRGLSSGGNGDGSGTGALRGETNGFTGFHKEEEKENEKDWRRDLSSAAQGGGGGAHRNGNGCGNGIGDGGAREKLNGDACNGKSEEEKEGEEDTKLGRLSVRRCSVDGTRDEFHDAVEHDS
mmetsp:Transcript_27041/g.66305  ORF Transcript_27041/g.66305 Transcript_27041/m.66305 type:complete len:196 (+) Transcript_27041:260-847(+)